MSDMRELLTRAYTAFNARDIDPVLSLMHPDVDWPNAWERGRVVGHILSDAMVEHAIRSRGVSSARWMFASCNVISDRDYSEAIISISFRAACDERPFRRIHPVKFSVRPFDQPVQRRDQSCDDLSHVVALTTRSTPSVLRKWDTASETALVTWSS
jgi:hypothetical protein